MANRHLARSIVLQTLYEMDFRSYPDTEAPEVFSRNTEEFAQEIVDKGFMKELLDGVLKKRSELDLIITKAAPDWPLEKISTTDRNILRIGLYELLFADAAQVPAKVAINEAIELAKSYGGEKSGKFINGVLGSVYKELGEPGKDEVSKNKDKNKKRIPDIPYEKMPIKKLGGAVVYAVKEGEIYFALVHDVFGHWTLSKGKFEDGEDQKTGTMRKIKEEIGLDLEIQDELSSNEYIANHPEEGKIRKQVVYFLAKAPYQELKLEVGGGLNEARWFRVAELKDLNFYGDIMPIITKAISILNERGTSV